MAPAKVLIQVPCLHVLPEMLTAAHVTFWVSDVPTVSYLPGSRRGASSVSQTGIMRGRYRIFRKELVGCIEGVLTVAHMNPRDTSYIIFYSILYYTILYYTILYYTILDYTIL